MLARVANNLFWMGRYIERSEHIARYLNVNYFSSLDAPNVKSQDTVKLARENANSARDLISTELYEAINKFYHFVLNYPKDVFVKNGLHDFTSNIAEMTAILRGKIRGTLLHDSVYAIIMMGINIERATQITRMINSKYNDALLSQGSYGDKFSKSFEWTTLLKCAESYDMMRRFYKKTPTSISTLEFLILNPNCPRSVMNSLNQVNEHVRILNPEKRYNKESTGFLIGRVRAEYEFKYIEEIEEDIKAFIENILDSLVKISDKVDEEFFNY